ncbi:hypothetical protein FACS189490_08500 [Clostridia bacterium]|nr:hypothetical protein FACS189490_08500 [Clostridia bacterium]
MTSKLVSEIISSLGLSVLGGEAGLSNTAENIYVCDLLSWVMGRAPENCAWVTIQGHINIMAVASLAEMACVIVAENAEVAPEAIAKANEQGIPLLRSDKPAHEVVIALSK